MRSLSRFTRDELMATAIAHVAGISTRQKMEYIEKPELTSSKRLVVINKPNNNLLITSFFLYIITSYLKF